jgi:hypothetical protein
VFEWAASKNNLLKNTFKKLQAGGVDLKATT